MVWTHVYVMVWCGGVMHSFSSSPPCTDYSYNYYCNYNPRLYNGSVPVSVSPFERRLDAGVRPWWTNINNIKEVKKEEQPQPKIFLPVQDHQHRNGHKKPNKKYGSKYSKKSLHLNKNGAAHSYSCMKTCLNNNVHRNYRKGSKPTSVSFYLFMFFVTQTNCFPLQMLLYGNML